MRLDWIFLGNSNKMSKTGQNSEKSLEILRAVTASYVKIMYAENGSFMCFPE